MTRNKKTLGIRPILASLSPRSFHLEMRKSSRGAVAVVSGVMSVNEYSDELIELMSHSGRMTLVGESLGVSVLEGRVLEVYGRITEVRFSYGKN